MIMPGRLGFRRLAAEIRADIEAGRYSPGEILPSEAELARSRGVGRDLVRNALTLLRAWGYVSPRQGAGWFVREAREHEPVSLVGPIRITARMPTAAERQRWDLDDGVPVLVVVRDGGTRVYPADRTTLEL